MICNVCKHDVRQLGKEWKCNEGCRCLMLGCIAVDKPLSTVRGPIRVWLDNVELPDELIPKQWCNCTVIDQFHARGEPGCIHMRPSAGVVNR